MRVELLDEDVAGSSSGESVQVQRITAGHEDDLFALALVRYRGATNPADILMPQGCAVAGSNDQQIPGGVTGDCQISVGGEYARRRTTSAVRVFPHDFSGPIIDGA
jgi:hypothetical protein